MSEAKNAWNALWWLGLAAFTISLPLHAQETSRQSGTPGETEQKSTFSGPQPGEALPPLKARVVIGDGEGQKVQLVSKADGKPTFLIFMNEWNEQVAELMRVTMLYAEQRDKPELLKAVVWLTSDPHDLETRLKRARPHMPQNTRVCISHEGLEGPGAYGLNRYAQMTIIIAKNNVVTSSFALVQPSVKGDCVAILHELVRVIGGEPPTLSEVLTPRNRQIVATRIELMVDRSATDKRVEQLARLVESFVKSRPDAKRTLGQLSIEIVQSGRFNDRSKAVGYLRRWAQEYADLHNPTSAPPQ